MHYYSPSPYPPPLLLISRIFSSCTKTALCKNQWQCKSTFSKSCKNRLLRIYIWLVSLLVCILQIPSSTALSSNYSAQGIARRGKIYLYSTFQAQWASSMCCANRKGSSFMLSGMWMQDRCMYLALWQTRSAGKPPKNEPESRRNK